MVGMERSDIMDIISLYPGPIHKEEVDISMNIVIYLKYVMTNQKSYQSWDMTFPTFPIAIVLSCLVVLLPSSF
jgi:hypothetical protein